MPSDRARRPGVVCVVHFAVAGGCRMSEVELGRAARRRRSIVRRDHRDGRALVRRAIVLPASIAIAVGVLACTRGPAQVRRFTYPPDFQYIPQQRLNETMWQLARDVHALDRLLRAPGEPPAEQRTRALALLAAIDQEAAGLQSGGMPSNHPHLDANLARFRADVGAARAAATLDPPHYYLAGSLSGACLYCHHERR